MIAQRNFLSDDQVGWVKPRERTDPVTRGVVHPHGDNQGACGDYRIRNALDDARVECVGVIRRYAAGFKHPLAVQVDLECIGEVVLLEGEPGFVWRDLHVQAIPQNFRARVGKVLLQRAIWVHDRPFGIVEVGPRVCRIVALLDHPSHAQLSGPAEHGSVVGLRAEQRGRHQREGKERKRSDCGQTPQRAKGNAHEHRVGSTSSRRESKLTPRSALSRRKSRGVGPTTAEARAALTAALAARAQEPEQRRQRAWRRTPAEDDRRRHRMCA